VISTIVFRPTDVAGADGWTETGAPLVGPVQPPNRALPAPIFDSGNDYRPNNSAHGNWVIRKIVTSDVAGPGFLTIPPGTFPTGGGIYADDVIAQIRLNGVAVPFAGIGTGVLPVQSVAVTWLAGANNVLEIEIANTIGTGTSVTGRLVANGAGVPCDCCDVEPPTRCAFASIPFTGVTETASQAGWNQVALSATADDVTQTSGQSGYNSPAGTTASTTLEVTYTHVTPQDRVRGLRLWNQAGSDLNDSDGLGTFQAEFYAGAVLQATINPSAVNGGAAQTFVIPGGAALNGITRVVLRNLGKLSGSTVAPLWRELQLIVPGPVFACRRLSGSVEWYDLSGDRVPTAEVFDC
jgi:hypothetical protein